MVNNFSGMGQFKATSLSIKQALDPILKANKIQRQNKLIQVKIKIYYSTCKYLSAGLDQETEREAEKEIRGKNLTTIHISPALD